MGEGFGEGGDEGGRREGGGHWEGDLRGNFPFGLGLLVEMIPLLLSFFGLDARMDDVARVEMSGRFHCKKMGLGSVEAGITGLARRFSGLYTV